MSKAPENSEKSNKPEEQAAWRLRAEQRVYDGTPWVSLYRQEVILPDGSLIDDYHRLALPDFSVIYATTPEDDVLLLKLYKHGLGKVTHTLPGGAIDPGEDPLEAAKRELLEETGYQATDWQDLGHYTVNGNMGAGCGYFFKAKNATLIQKSNSGDLEDMQLITLPRAELMTMVRSNQIELLNHVACISLAQMF